MQDELFEKLNSITNQLPNMERLHGEDLVYTITSLLNNTLGLSGYNMDLSEPSVISLNGKSTICTKCTIRISNCIERNAYGFKDVSLTSSSLSADMNDSASMALIACIRMLESDSYVPSIVKLETGTLNNVSVDTNSTIMNTTMTLPQSFSDKTKVKNEVASEGNSIYDVRIEGTVKTRGENGYAVDVTVGKGAGAEKRKMILWKNKLDENSDMDKINVIIKRLVPSVELRVEGYFEEYDNKVTHKIENQLQVDRIL